MTPEFEVSTARLRDLATGLQREVDTLRTRKVDPSPTPDAGRSSGEVAGALGHLTSATADLANLCEAIASRLNQTATAYDDADARAVTELERLGRLGP